MSHNIGAPQYPNRGRIANMPRLLGLIRLLVTVVAVSAVAVGLAMPSMTSVRAAAVPRDEVPVAPPLHTQGRVIVDQLGQQVHLASASWYGAESVDYVPGGLQTRPIADIARQIRQLGFNTIRLQWSNQMVESNPIVPDYAVAANPGLRGRHALDIFDSVVHALTAQRIMVLLDNHNSNAEWCCGGNDGNMLWYNAQYPESNWIADWDAMVARYRGNPLVVGVDLRNEPRAPATWGGPAATDWHAAAERGGNAVLSVNPNLLVLVEGVSYAGDLSGVNSLPVTLDVPDRVVYEAHDYSWYTGGYTSYEGWYQEIYPRWGYLVTGPSPQPLFVGEYGTCNTTPTCVNNPTPGTQGFWFNVSTTFLANYRVSWSYWALNGTQSTGAGRTWNAPETYGILNTGWDGPSSIPLLTRLQQIEFDSAGASS